VLARTGVELAGGVPWMLTGAVSWGSLVLFHGDSLPQS